MKRLCILVFAVTTLFSALYFSDDDNAMRVAGADSTSANSPKKTRVAGQNANGLAQRLTAARWPAALAMAVERAAGPSSEALLAQPEALDLLVSLRPGQPDGIAGPAVALLTRHPCTAGLLVRCGDPAILAEGILSTPSQEDQECLISSCAKYLDRSALNAWGRALQQHGPLVAQLLAHCPSWPVDAAFTFDRQAAPETASVYDRWIESALAPNGRLLPPPEAASMLQFILEHGSELRQQMAADPSFDLPGLWARLVGCVTQEAQASGVGPLWHCMAGQTELWALMRRPNGEELYRHAGMIAADMLSGPGALPVTMHPRLETLLLQDSQSLLNSLQAYGQNANFQTLVFKLDDGGLDQMCRKLGTLPPLERPAAMAKWATLSNQATIMEDIGPQPGLIRVVPLYSVYYAVRKFAQGRDLNLTDLAAIVEFTGLSNKVMAAKDTADRWGVFSHYVRENASEALSDAVSDKSHQLAENALARPNSHNLPPPPQGKTTVFTPEQARSTLKDAPDQMRTALASGPVGLDTALSDLTRWPTTTGPSFNGPCLYCLEKNHVQFQLLNASRVHVTIAPDSPMAGALVAAQRTAASASLARPSSTELWQQQISAWWLAQMAMPEDQLR